MITQVAKSLERVFLTFLFCAPAMLMAQEGDTIREAGPDSISSQVPIALTSISDAEGPFHHVSVIPGSDKISAKFYWRLNEGVTAPDSLYFGHALKTDIKKAKENPDHEVKWSKGVAVSSKDGSLKVGGLDYGKKYSFRVGYRGLDGKMTYREVGQVLKNIHATADDDGEIATIYWTYNTEFLGKLDQAVIKYTTDINAKREKEGMTNVEPWKQTKAIDITEGKYTIEGLDGGEKYKFKVAYISNGSLDEENAELVWSESGKFKAKRAFGWFKFLMLIGALGLFIYGMKVMSEGLQRFAGSRLRDWLGSITSNRIKGVLTGFGITSIVQSSSVTTVMTVSFVNAGLMTLRQSAGVMMGANIGTTITAWLILLLGFKVSITSYALVLLAPFVVLLFIERGKSKALMSAIFGFAILFIGLGELKDAVPSLGADSAIVQFFLEYKDAGFGATLMFIALGALVTVIIQSSSAAMALTMTMVGSGILPFEVACAMILGENIGTTITAEIASLVGNVHAKRSARIHSLFNIIGVGWMCIVFPFFVDGLVSILSAYQGGDFNPSEDPGQANLVLASFHTAFNLINVVVLIWFVPWLVKVAEKTVKSKGGADEDFRLDYISTGMMATPDMSLLEAKKEVAKFGEITGRMSMFTRELLTESDRKKKSKLYARIAKYEEITDRVEVEIANYLARVAQNQVSENMSRRVLAMNSIANDLERIGDIFYQMSKTIERKEESKIWFSPEQRDKLLEMFRLIDKAFAKMVENLNASYGSVTMVDANELETRINNLRNEMRREHLRNLENPEYNKIAGMVYSDLFMSCEKVGDHIHNVTEALQSSQGAVSQPAQ